MVIIFSPNFINPKDGLFVFGIDMKAEYPHCLTYSHKQLTPLLASLKENQMLTWHTWRGSHKEKLPQTKLLSRLGLDLLFYDCSKIWGYIFLPEC